MVTPRCKGLLIKHDVRSRDFGMKYAIWVKYPLSAFQHNYNNIYGTIFRKVKAKFKRIWNLNTKTAGKNRVKTAAERLRSSPTYMENIRDLKIAGIVNVYPQAINRMFCDKNKNLSTLDPCDLQVISQHSKSYFFDFDLTFNSQIR